MQPLNNTEVVAKADFARLVGVSRGRVSQWIAEGKISGDALDGSGRKARIRVGNAKAQLRRFIDIGQRLGNGIDTRIDDAPSAPTTSIAATPTTIFPPAEPVPPLVPAEAAIEDRIKRERLEQLQRANRKLAEEEAARAGRYVLAADVAQQLGSALARQLAWVDGVLSELATAMTVKFGISQRDALYLLRTEFHACRARGSVQFKAQAESLPVLIEDEALELNQAISSEDDDD
jgi:hypothetical protein